MKLHSSEHFPGNQYEPTHTRKVYKAYDGSFIGITTTDGKDVVITCCSTKFETERILAKMTNAYFRSEREITCPECDSLLDFSEGHPTDCNTCGLELLSARDMEPHDYDPNPDNDLPF